MYANPAERVLQGSLCQLQASKTSGAEGPGSNPASNMYNNPDALQDQCAKM